MLYHITERKNLPSILERGLIPCFTKSLISKYFREPFCIWLTNNYEKIINEQMGLDYFLRKDMIILKVNVKELIIKDVIYTGGAKDIISSFEKNFFGIINPERLSIHEYSLKINTKINTKNDLHISKH